MKNLRLISLLIGALFSACSSTGGLRSAGKRAVQRSDLYPVMERQGTKKEAWFNISIQFFKSEQSGQLLVKQTNDTTTRVVFMTAVGFKIFDFAITPHDFTIHTCIDPLRKKNILRIMEKDFRLMFCTNLVYEPSKIYSSKSDTGIVVYKLRIPGKSYYRVNEQKKTLIHIDNHAFPVGGAKVNFEYTEGSLLPKIHLKQKGIKLRFELEPFPK